MRCFGDVKPKQDADQKKPTGLYFSIKSFRYSESVPNGTLTVWNGIFFGDLKRSRNQ